MLHIAGENYICKYCEKTLTENELLEGWGVCYACAYADDGDFDCMPPRYEPHGREK